MAEEPRYYSNSGPKHGPARARDAMAALGVLATPEPVGRDPWMPIGIAYPAGWIPDDRGPIRLFRLVVHKVQVPGWFALVGRRFLPAGPPVSARDWRPPDFDTPPG